MVNITHQYNTLRKVLATAIVKVSEQETIITIQQHKVPKGDIFEFSRPAGPLAIKSTCNFIPGCHPKPVEYSSIHFSIEGMSIHITVEVHTIYKTGMETEAMHGATVVALTMYDMLKPIDKGVEISNIYIQNDPLKKENRFPEAVNIKTAVIMCSDSVYAGKKEDSAGKIVAEKLRKYNIEPETYLIIPDDLNTIQSTVRELSTSSFDLVIISGGTGLSARDITPEAITPMIDKMVPGIMEAARRYGQDRTPYAMLSRGVAGFIKNMLVLTLPGSTKGSAESMDALFPSVHIFSVKLGASHE